MIIDAGTLPMLIFLVSKIFLVLVLLSYRMTRLPSCAAKTYITETQSDKAAPLGCFMLKAEEKKQSLLYYLSEFLCNVVLSRETSSCDSCNQRE